MQHKRSARIAGCAVALAGLAVPAVALGGGPSGQTSSGGSYAVPSQVGTLGSTGSAGGASAAAAKRGVTYAGSTSNQDPLVIKLSKNGKQVTSVVETWTTKCASGETWPELAQHAGKVNISRSGSFSAGLQARVNLGGNLLGAISEAVTGKVNGTKISGKATATVNVVDTQTAAIVDVCNYKANFKIVSSKGKVFGGATSQHGAVVAELNSSAKKVSHLHFGWGASCQPNGSVVLGDTVGGFPISRGAFGDTFSQRFARPDGGQNKFDYSVRGKISGSSASGKLSVGVTFTNLLGAQEATCSSGSVTWKAQSG